MILDPLHPAVIHFPIVLLIAGFVLAAIVLIRPSRSMAIASAIILTLATIGSQAAMMTGEKEEETGERASRAVYEQHEEGAELEVLAVQLSATQMFGSPLQIELTARVFDRDLAGVRRVSDQIAQLAAEAPGWVPQQHLAEGYYQQLRGDLPAAVLAFERSFALNHPGQIDPPPCFNTWAFAARGFVATLVELERAEEARRFGLRACEYCRAQATSWIDVVECELALAEASVGEFASAAARLDALIERNLDKTPARLSSLYEARVRVAIRARDEVAAVQYAELATRDLQGGSNHKVLQRHARMLEEARRANIDLKLAQSGFEDSVLGAPRSNDRSAVAARALRDVQRVAPNARSQRILEVVCEAADSPAGKLYLAHGELLTRVASTGEAAEPALDAFASGYFRQQLEIAFETNAVTEITAGVTSEPMVGSWTSPRGTQYRFIALTQIVDGELAFSGLVALELAPSRPIPPHTQILARALAPELAACAG